ncbi:hypothetical protein LB553_01070 [Mesorhizobium sp. CA8]|uniref:hypothetical protein n=1 Tax=Mesorhizobium sp. CA8 TaxID=2876637 RepID=UPI001CCD5ABA|nr:hypothetical protein [Mesorhizobium sp. CA8]MBZ9759479.1 hypothetical protein [Mesorhizobium sp. CA8]
MIKMIAAKRIYDGSVRKEYKPGQEFEIASEREAAKLERTHKAVRKTFVQPAMVDIPAVRLQPEGAPGEPKRRGRPPKYLRRDMTVMDGQSGEEIPLPSSLQEPPQEEQTSESSESAPE